MNTPQNIIRPEVELIGQDGNAFFIIGRVSRALREAGNDKAVVDAFREEAMSGNYDHVLRTVMEYADIC